MVIKVQTRDKIIWNLTDLICELCDSMAHNQDIIIDLNSEGPDCKEIGLYNIIEKCALKFNYNLERISINTCNVLEQHNKIQIHKSLSWHLLDREVNMQKDTRTAKKNNLKHFGRFIGRSNAPRLILSTYLEDNYPDKVLSSYRYDFRDEYHKDQIGIESLINDFQIYDISPQAKFLASCPKVLTNTQQQFSNQSQFDYYEQMMEQDKNQFVRFYQDFFVEIVSETYFTGNTFFITEKTCRPIMLETPFIIQGPTGFLKRLKNLGFKTFDNWWDEGYDEDPPNWSIKEIIKVIDYLANKSQEELYAMLQDMQHILVHNRNHLIEMVNNVKSTK